MSGSHNRVFSVEIEFSEGVYITNQSDVPGLVLESESLIEFKEALYDAVPELLESNLGISTNEMGQVTVQVFLPRERTIATNKTRFLFEQSQTSVEA